MHNHEMFYQIAKTGEIMARELNVVGHDKKLKMTKSQIFSMGFLRGLACCNLFTKDIKVKISDLAKTQAKDFAESILNATADVIEAVLNNEEDLDNETVEIAKMFRL